MVTLHAVRGGQTFRIRVRTKAQCPLTLAMNFATNLVANAGGARLGVFPAYGARRRFGASGVERLGVSSWAGWGRKARKYLPQSTQRALRCWNCAFASVSLWLAQSAYKQ